MRRGVTLGIILFSASVSAILVYALYHLQASYLNHQQMMLVAAPTKFIPSGYVLQHGDVKLVRIPQAAYSKQMLRSEQSLVGKAAAVALGKGEAILQWKVVQNPLIPKLGEATFQIPKNYLVSISNEIRSGDQVYVYVSSPKGSSELLFPQPVVVAAVKTANNQEVVDAIEPGLPSQLQSNKQAIQRSRRNANGSIDFVNLNLTESQWLLIDNYCKSGSAKIALAYANYQFEKEGES